MLRDSKGRSTVIDLTGQRFTRLTVMRLARIQNHAALWECLCDCGMAFFTFSSNLRNGHSKSCGCLTIERKRRIATTHGMSKSPEFRSWAAMKRRCYNPNDNRYYRYGGRGITVCARWRGKKGFANFLADMGRKPTLEHSIDRYPDNNGNYEPNNCRWATRIQQWDNRRKVKVCPNLIVKAVASSA